MVDPEARRGLGHLPGAILNIVNGPGAEIGKALASNRRIAKIAFTGETVTGRLIMQYAAQNIIPSATELGGKSPNIFFGDVLAADDEFLDKASVSMARSRSSSPAGAATGVPRCASRAASSSRRTRT